MKMRSIWAWGLFVGAVLNAVVVRGAISTGLDLTATIGSLTTYSYSISITAKDQIINGSFYRIYDFANLTGTPTAPIGWTVSVSYTDPVPPPNVVLTHGDDPTLPNVTFTYSGANPITGLVTISNFVLSTTSPTSYQTFKDFVARDVSASNGQPVDSIGSLIVPAPVPEPASLAVIVLGGMSVLVRRRR